MLNELLPLFDSPGGHVALPVGLALLALLGVDVVFRHVVLRLTARTKTTVDDQVVATLRPPIAVSILLVGIWFATQSLPLGDRGPAMVRGVLLTTAVVHWGWAGWKLSRLLLEVLVEFHQQNQHRQTIVSRRTVPIFDIAGKTLVVGTASYLLLVAWNVNVTGWLASAGVIGLAVGFAAQDTLSNLFAGVFILADAPYKLGDFLVLDSGERGQVTDIGLRSTRLLTTDDVEIVVPNSKMATTKVINESGGPHEALRLRLPVGVAYGSDVDRVRTLLFECACDAEHVLKQAPHEPLVHLVRFGESALEFQIKVWVEHPLRRGRVRDRINTLVYKRLAAEGIEIPFPRRDVHLRTDEPLDVRVVDRSP